LGPDSETLLTVARVIRNQFIVANTSHKLSNTRADVRRAAFATERGRCGRRVGVPVGSDAAMQ